MFSCLKSEDEETNSGNCSRYSILRWTLLVLLIINFILSIVVVATCNFATVDYGWMDGIFCHESYRYNDATASRVASRFFGTMTVLMVGGAVAIILLVQLFVPNNIRLWWCLRILVLLSTLFQSGVFAVIKDYEDEYWGEWEISAGAVLAIVNTGLLLAAVLFSWLVGPPKEPVFKLQCASFWRRALLFLLLATFSLSIVVVATCDFAHIDDWYEVGIFCDSHYYYDEPSAGTVASRFFGTMTALMLGFAVVIMLIVQLFLSKGATTLWLSLRILITVSALFQAGVFTVVKDYDWGDLVLAKGAIIAIVNCGLLLASSAVSWLVGPPEEPIVKCRSTQRIDCTCAECCSCSWYCVPASTRSAEIENPSSLPQEQAPPAMTHIEEKAQVESSDVAETERHNGVDHDIET